MQSNPTDEELELALLFESGVSLEDGGDILPLPSMPLLAPPPNRHDTSARSVAEVVDEGEVHQQDTGEEIVHPQMMALDRGMEVELPDGTIDVIRVLDRAKKRLGFGPRKQRRWYSLNKVRTINAERLAKQIMRERERANVEEGIQEAVDEVVLPPNMPEGLFPWQVDSAAFVMKHGSALLALEMGLGKQHPVDTKVLTPRGWREIGSLQEGDDVIGSNGQATQVEGVFPQGVKANYRVFFSDGSSVETGDEHLWTVMKRLNGSPPYKWEELVVTTGQLRTGAVIEVPSAAGGGRKVNLSKATLYLPMLSAPAEFGATEPPVPGYTMGQLLANASLSHGTPQLSTNDKDWAEVRGFMETEGIEFGSVRKYPGCFRASIPGYSKRMQALEVDVHSRDKRIPAMYFRATPETRIALLQGLMDGDGHASKTRNKVSYHTTSKGLAHDVQELVECLGGIASVREYDRSHEDKPTDYQVRIRTPLDIPPFRVRRKLSRWNPGTHAAPKRTFVRAEYTRDVESVCIRVAADDRLYVTEHAILTHNTLTSIACIETPAVVVCPSMLKVNWAREINNWRPELSVAVISGRKTLKTERHAKKSVQVYADDKATKAAREADVIIVNYDIVDAHVDWLVARNNRTVIADEAHYLKSFSTSWSRARGRFEIRSGVAKRTIAFAKLIGRHPEEMREAPQRLMLLTGTPVLNRVIELWPLVYFLDPSQTMNDGASGGFQNRGHFCRRYCAGFYDVLVVRGGREQTVLDCNGRSNSGELHQRLTERYMVRRTKEAELTFLPPKQRRTKHVDLDPSTWREYKRARDEFLEWVADNGGPEAVVSAQQAQALVRLTKLRALSARGKAAAMVQQIVSFFVSTQRPLVVMGRHREAFALIEKGLEDVNVAIRAAHKKSKNGPADRPVRFGKVLGGMTSKQRQKAVDDFQLHGVLDVLLYSIPLATGTTLTRATDMFFFEREWRPADNVQAEDRIHRIGQENQVMITYYDAAGTLDEAMGQLLIDKTQAAAAVIDGVELDADEAAWQVMGDMWGTVLGAEGGIRLTLDQMDKAVMEGHRQAEESLREIKQNPRMTLIDEDGEWVDYWGEDDEED